MVYLLPILLDLPIYIYTHMWVTVIYAILRILIMHSVCIHTYIIIYHTHKSPMKMIWWPFHLFEYKHISISIYIYVYLINSLCLDHGTYECYEMIYPHIYGFEVRKAIQLLGAKKWVIAPWWLGDQQSEQLGLISILLLMINGGS